MIDFQLLHRNANQDTIGLIPLFLSPADPRPAREQLNANYAHGGGWRPMKGFTKSPTGDLLYPNDPPLPLYAKGQLRSETITIYDCGFVGITQPDGSFEVSRMD